MNKKVIAGIIIGIAALVVATQSMFVVRPDQFAIVTEFGDPVEVIAQEVCPDEERDADGKCLRPFSEPAPGLYFKMPFVQDVRYLDARVRGWDDEARDTKTVELRTIDFVAFARWRIADPLRFYTAARTEQRAMAGMDSIVTARIQAAVREHKLAEIVRDRGRKFEQRAALDLLALVDNYEECQPSTNPAIRDIIAATKAAAGTRGLGDTEKIEALRAEIVEDIRQKSSDKLMEEFGIRVFDLHFKYLNYSEQVWDKMIDAIRADRKRDIAAYRKIGDTCVGSIDQVKERLKGEILGSRDREVREILGRAKANAIETRARAFNSDPEFFRFLKTLELYEASLVNNTKIVLASDSPLLSLLNDPTVLKPVDKLDLPPLELPKDLGPDGSSPVVPNVLPIHDDGSGGSDGKSDAGDAPSEGKAPAPRPEGKAATAPKDEPATAPKDEAAADAKAPTAEPAPKEPAPVPAKSEPAAEAGGAP